MKMKLKLKSEYIVVSYSIDKIDLSLNLLMSTGTREILRYTLGQLSDLNNGKHLQSGTAYNIFSSYPAPHIDDYLNTHNKRFFPPKSESTQVNASQTPVFALKKAHAHSDQKISEDIRKIISNISKGSGKIQLAIQRMNQLSIPSTQAKNVAELFHLSMIECDFLIDEYLAVLVGFTNPDKVLMELIYRHFTDMITGEFRKPSKFTDSHAETGFDKELRWRIRNATIIAKMYNLKLPDTAEFAYVKASLTTPKIVTNFLSAIFTNLSHTDNSTTQLFVAVWTALTKGTYSRLVTESPENYDSFKLKIKELISSPLYKTTDKVRLMELL